MTPDSAPAPTPTGQQATVRDFLTVVFRRRLVIVGLFAATTATVLWIAFSTPLTYMSSGRVLVRRGEKDSVFDQSRQVTGTWEEDLSSELQVVRSVPVMDRARAFLAAQAETAGAPAPAIVPAGVDAEVVGKSNVISIAYSHGDPRVARLVCAAVIRAYLEFRSQEISQINTRQYFEAELAKVKSELDRNVESRRRFANAEGVVDLVEERRGILSRLSLSNQRESENEVDLAEARAARKGMQDLRDLKQVDLPTFSSHFSNENALVTIKSKLIDQQVRLVQLRERYRDDSPEVVAAEATLDTLRLMLEREVDARLAMWDSRIAMLESRRSVLEAEQAELNVRLDPMMDRETQLGILERDISLLKTRYEDLIRRNDQARLNEKTRVNINLVLLSPAGPGVPQNSRDYARLALAPAFSVVVGLGLAFFFDGIDVTVHSRNQAEEATRLPVLAAIRERRRRA